MNDLYSWLEGLWEKRVIIIGLAISIPPLFMAARFLLRFQEKREPRKPPIDLGPPKYVPLQAKRVLSKDGAKSRTKEQIDVATFCNGCGKAVTGKSYDCPKCGVVCDACTHGDYSNSVGTINCLGCGYELESHYYNND